MADWLIFLAPLGGLLRVWWGTGQLSSGEGFDPTGLGRGKKQIMAALALWGYVMAHIAFMTHGQPPDIPTMIMAAGFAVALWGSWTVGTDTYEGLERWWHWPVLGALGAVQGASSVVWWLAFGPLTLIPVLAGATKPLVYWTMHRFPNMSASLNSYTYGEFAFHTLLWAAFSATFILGAPA